MSSKATKPKPRVGDEAYEVEWCAGIPVDENGDRDHDRADNRFSRFKDHDKACEYAQSVLPKDAYGSVTVTPIEFVAYDEEDAFSHPHVGFWQHSGEPTVIDVHKRDCDCQHCVDDAQQSEE